MPRARFGTTIANYSHVRMAPGRDSAVTDQVDSHRGKAPLVSEAYP
jgi:hypothetical protein